MDIELHIAALQDEDPAVRQAAAAALMGIGAPAVEPLIAALREEDDTGRWMAASTLGKIGAPAVEPLIAALRDEDAEVRWMAMWALWQLEDDLALNTFIAALKDENSGVRQAVIEWLARPEAAEAIREEYLAFLLSRTAWVLLQAEETNLAVQASRRALEATVAIRDISYRAEVLSEIAWVLSLTGENNLAVEAGLQARHALLMASEWIGNLENAAGAEIKIAWVFSKAGKADLAVQAARRAMIAAEAIRDEKPKAFALRGIAQIFEQAGETELAAQAAERADRAEYGGFHLTSSQNYTDYTGRSSDLKERRGFFEVLRKVFREQPQTLLQFLSIAYPRRLSKGDDPPFLVTLFPENAREIIKKMIAGEFGDEEIAQKVVETTLHAGMEIVIEPASHDIDFKPERYAARLQDGPNLFRFTCKPKADSLPGKRRVIVVIKDQARDQVIMAVSVDVWVVDYLTDHIPRSLVSKAGSAILGISSLVTYALTFLEQIDRTAGLASGTAFFVFAALVYAQFQAIYRRVQPTQTLG